MDILTSLATPRYPAGPSPLVDYKNCVLRDKTIYHHLNMF
jgi:hypothetical protein